MWVQSKRKCGSLESCVCIVGFPACGCQKKSVVYEMECRHEAVQRGKPVQFFQERCCVVMTGCQENKSWSKVLNFLERLDDRIRCTHKETVAVVKPWKDVGSDESLGCVFSEKPAEWTNAFKLEISSLADFYDVLLHGQFWDKNESKIPGRIREGDVVRVKSNRIREGNGRRFQGRRKGKEKSFCFVVVQFELIFRHPCFYVVCACTEFFGEVGHFIERSGFLELCVICEKMMVYRVVSYDIGKRRSVQDEENGPQYWALRHTVHELWWWRRRVIDWSGLIPVIIVQPIQELQWASKICCWGDLTNGNWTSTSHHESGALPLSYINKTIPPPITSMDHVM